MEVFFKNLPQENSNYYVVGSGASSPTDQYLHHFVLAMGLHYLMLVTLKDLMQLEQVNFQYFCFQ